VIERQIPRQTIWTENTDRRGIVLGAWRTARFTQIHRRYRVPARIAVWVGIHAQQRRQRYVERRLFLRFAPRRLFHAFPNIHKATGDCPTGWRVLALDQHNRPPRAIDQLNDGIGGDGRCHRCGHNSSSEIREGGLHFGFGVTILFK